MKRKKSKKWTRWIIQKHKTMNKKFILVFFIVGLNLILKGQERLTKEKALDLALENNFGIQVSRNTTEIQKNNSNILNSGYLPTLSLSGGVIM